MRSPRDSSKAPMAAAATPLPKEDSTPPVMKMILVFTSPLLYLAKPNVKEKSGGRLREKRWVNKLTAPEPAGRNQPDQCRAGRAGYRGPGEASPPCLRVYCPSLRGHQAVI